MDKIVLIVNGPLPVRASSNTIVIQNIGLSPDAPHNSDSNIVSEPIPASKPIDLDIKEPKTGRILKLSKMIEEDKVIKQEIDKPEKKGVA